MFQNIIQIVKESYYFNGYKWRRVPLACSKKTTSIIKRNNVKTPL